VGWGRGVRRGMIVLLNRDRISTPGVTDLRDPIKKKLPP